MKHTHHRALASLAACGVAGAGAATVLVPAQAVAGSSGPRVSLRVEGLDGTILTQRTVDVPAGGSITQGGVAAGLCPADSAQGALAVGTRGHWRGTWYASYHEYEVTQIGSTAPNPKHDYFEIFVNGTAASAGACELKLKSGDSLLFAVVPSSGAAELPLSVSAVARGSALIATVTTGRGRGVGGATVSVAGRSLRTGAGGRVRFTGLPHRRLRVTATKPGAIRDETTVTVR